MIRKIGRDGVKVLGNDDRSCANKFTAPLGRRSGGRRQIELVAVPGAGRLMGRPRSSVPRVDRGLLVAMFMDSRAPERATAHRSGRG